jgi:DNA-binding GntR family transcriptional regulator
MSASSAISRESLSDRIRRILLERILDGTYPPGHRLVEMKIARELKTSQGPVREALRELEALQVIHTEAYKGTRVREVSAREMREAYGVRAVLEQFAAELAADRLKGRVEHLEELAETIRAAAEAGDAEAYAIHDLAFHRAILEASGNTILMRTWESLGFELRLRVLLSTARVDLVQAQQLHRTIVSALGKGDAETAGKLLREHVDSFVSQVKLEST